MVTSSRGREFLSTGTCSSCRSRSCPETTWPNTTWMLRESGKGPESVKGYTLRIKDRIDSLVQMRSRLRGTTMNIQNNRIWLSERSSVVQVIIITRYRNGGMESAAEPKDSLALSLTLPGWWNRKKIYKNVEMYPSRRCLMFCLSVAVIKWLNSVQKFLWLRKGKKRRLSESYQSRFNLTWRIASHSCSCHGWPWITGMVCHGSTWTPHLERINKSN